MPNVVVSPPTPWKVPLTTWEQMRAQVADRLRCSMRPHDVCGQTDEGPQPHAGDRTSESGVQGQAGWAGSGLHRHRHRTETGSARILAKPNIGVQPGWEG